MREGKEMRVEQGHYCDAVLHYGEGEIATMSGNSIISVMKNSPTVNLWKYNEGVLVVSYKGSNYYWHYEGVPMSFVFRMMASDSVGAFISKEMKRYFRVERTLTGVL